MFRTICGRLSPWESLLSAELLQVPEELAQMDALLHDTAFCARSRSNFHQCWPTAAPIECYPRLMFRKFRYRLGYESVCAEGERFGLLAAVPRPVVTPTRTAPSISASSTATGA